MSVTLDDFEIRYINILSEYPDIERCSVKGCNNPVDITEGMGKDTSCAYHRMLFDAWFSHLDSAIINYYIENKNPRRRGFNIWITTLGKETCDKIVLQMAQEPINWMC